MSKILPENDFQDVLSIIQDGRSRLYQQANTILTDTYWAVGEIISKKVALSSWGKSTVTYLSKWLRSKDTSIKGFSASNLWRMRQFYELYSSEEKLVTVSRVLSWSHYTTLLGQCKSNEELLFYTTEAKRGSWSVRELRKKISSGEFERVFLAKGSLSTSISLLPQNVGGVFKDSYLIDFADLSEIHTERDLQKAIVSNLKQFLLELGSGFTFVGEEVKLQVGNSDFKLDLLFFHRDMQCLVAFELKRGAFAPRDLGQLSFYLEALDRQEKREHENPSIGVLLCRSKDDEVVKFALNATASPTLVSEYETKLVPKELLQKKLNEWYELLE